MTNRVIPFARNHALVFWGLFHSGLLMADAAQKPAESPSQLRPLVELTEIALARSPRIRSLQAKLDEARADQATARSHFLPTVGIATGVEKNPAFSNESGRLAYGYASWNLFNGFSDRRSAQLSGFDVAAAELELAAARFELELEIESAFYSILGAMKSFDEWTRAGAISESALRDVRQRRGAGMLSAGDVVAFEVRQSRINSEIADAKAAVDLAKAAFNRLIGHEIGQAITFSGEIPWLELAEPVEGILATAPAHAFAMRATAIDVAKSDVAATQWRAGLLPRVDLEARHGWLPLGERTPDRNRSAEPQSAFVLGAKFDIFSGFSTVSERSAALARKVQREESLRQASFDLLGQIERNLRRLVTFQQRLRAEQENMSRTSAYQETTAREYKSGIKTAQDYANAVDMLIDARRRHIEALQGWHEVRFDLEKAIGRRIAARPAINARTNDATKESRGKRGTAG